MAQWNADPQWTPIEQINSGTTFHSFLDISADDFNKLVENMQYLFLHSNKGGINMDEIYPVGSVYMTFNPAFNPITAFGGSWTRLTDRFLIGAGNNYKIKSTGGYRDAVVVAHSHEVQTRGGIGSSEITSGYNAILQTGLGNNNSIYTQTSGEDGTGKNMPPYLAVYMWERTA